MNLFGQVAGVASAEYSAAALLTAVVSMGSGVNDDGSFVYTASNRTILGIAVALNVFVGLVNSLSTYWMAKLTHSLIQHA